MYYKTKLQVHNFTLYNIKISARYCYTWDATHADLSNDVFAYIQNKHFKLFLESNPHIETQLFGVMDADIRLEIIIYQICISTLL